MTRQSQITWLCLAVFVSFIGLSLQQKANLRLKVEPRYIHVKKRTPVTVTCTLRDENGERVPLAGCGFKVYGGRAAWDSGSPTADTNNRTYGTINSQGLPQGQCSLAVAFPWMTAYIIGCRVRPAGGGAWLYASMMIDLDTFSPMQYHLQPSGVVVSLPGHDVTLVSQSDVKIDSCNFFLPPNTTVITLDPETTSENTTQYRAWLKDGRCGVTLLRVQPEHSGFVSSLGASFTLVRASENFVEFIVATPPVSPPRLSVNATDASFNAGDMLHATCVVEGSRPVSNITWLLGGEVVRKDNYNEAPAESTWRWNHEPQMIMQRLSRRLTQLDDGKELKCRAGHLALPSGSLDSNSHIVRVPGFH